MELFRNIHVTEGQVGYSSFGVIKLEKDVNTPSFKLQIFGEEFL
jgi:hypothetical protein